MNSCANIEIQEMLPDVLHGTLDQRTRDRVDSHLAGCESCRQELRMLTTVKAAAVFVPQIDANRVAAHIPPYHPIEPAFERPARPRVVSWLVAASLALVVAGGGSVLMTRGPSQLTPRAVAITAPQPSAPAIAANVDTPVRVPAASSVNAVGSENSIAVATDVAALTDGGLQQLMSEMKGFDGLPATEPEPVIAVDSADVAAQD